MLVGIKAIQTVYSEDKLAVYIPMTALRVHRYAVVDASIISYHHFRSLFHRQYLHIAPPVFVTEVVDDA